MRPLFSAVSRKVLLLFGAIYLVVLLGGWGVYSYLRDEIQRHVQADLKAIGEMKKSQIEDWLKERFGDANIFGNNSLLAAQVARALQSGAKDPVANDLTLDRMHDIQRVYHYSMISVYNTEGRLVLTTQTANGEDMHGPDARRALQRREPVLVDLHPDPVSTGFRPDFGIMQPIVVQGKTVGVFYFELDPEEYLYPLVQRWPEKSNTAETLLVRKEGDQALFLNTIRYRLEAPLTIKVPLTRLDVPAVKAALGQLGLVRGNRDYRGSPVLAYITNIEHTPWKMVAKIDESEALDEIRQLALVVFTAMLLLVLVTTVLMLTWLRQMKSQQTIQALQLEIESNQLAATIDAIPDVLFEMDANGRFYQVLDKNAPLLKTTVDLLLNHTVMDVMPREQGEAFMVALNEALEKGSSHGTQLCLQTVQGQTWVELSVARKSTPAGEVPRFIVLSRNITLQKQAESELLQHRDNLEVIVAERTSDAVKARIEAERASQAKSIFLTNMSHELRTPMHAILSFSSMGSERSKDAEDATTKKLHQYFDRITQSGNRLLMFVNDLLDLSKLEAAKMVLDIRRNDLHKIVTEVCEELVLVAEHKQITLDYQAVPAALMVSCDRVRLGQLLSNLLSNAIKFSPVMSTVSISAELAEIAGRRAEDASRPGVSVRVTDEGLGVPSNEVDTIFDKFVQSTRTATGAGGTGLGLAICREIITLHGGAIHAENNAERGASLIFTLPLDQSEGERSNE